MAYKFSFIMDQIAGHVTNYRNLRSVTDHDPEVNATWHEIYYHKTNGKLEWVHEKIVPFVPTYFTGIMRGSWETYRALRNLGYDALMTNASVHSLFSRTFEKIPTLIDFDSTPLQLDQMEAYGAGQNDLRPVANLKFRLARRAMHTATLLQAWSNWARQSAITDYGVDPAKIVVNPPGVDLEFWKPEPKLRNAVDAPRRVLFVGGDFQRKGGPQLLQWHKDQPAGQVELHIVTREKVEAQPGVYVYHNMQPNSPALLKLYQASDLFVLPSLGECFGIATVEAMGAGLPVIATDIGGTADIIEPGRNGFIIPSRDLNALTQAISPILNDEQRRLEMGRQSRLMAEQRFDLYKNGQLTLSYLKQIAHTSLVRTKNLSRTQEGVLTKNVPQREA